MTIQIPLNIIKNTFFLFLILLSQVSFSQVFDVKTIVQSGSNESRINLVILSDGYQNSELDQFVMDATIFSEVFFGESPYKEYKNFFNVHIIKVPSNESGASHPGDADDEPINSSPLFDIDNYFESTFDSYGVHRGLASNNRIVNNVLIDNFPAYDIALVLVNSPYYGGTGGEIAVSSLHTNGMQTAIHEIGHSFANLIDEYYAGDSYAREGINMTQETDPNNVRWKNWMDINDIGIYAHSGSGNAENWYRPHENCKMSNVTKPFCSVCIEGTIEQIHTATSPIESYAPNSTETINLSEPTTFNINAILPNPNTLNIQWKLNGEVLDMDDPNFSIVISEDDLSTGSNQLQAIVRDNTPLLKVDEHDTIHAYAILWNINAATLGIDEITTESLKISLLPNPTQNILNIDVTREINEDYGIVISDASGKQLISKNMKYSSQKPQINLSALPAGVYFINFKFQNGLNISKKIIKN